MIRAGTALAVSLLLLALTACDSGGENVPVAGSTGGPNTEEGDRFVCRLANEAWTNDNQDPGDNTAIGMLALNSADPGIVRSGQLLIDNVKAKQAGIEQRDVPHSISYGQAQLAKACVDLFGNSAFL